MQQPLKKDILPHESSSLYMTDGGVLTDLIFHYGLSLPCLSICEALKNDKGKEALKLYMTGYLNMAIRYHTGFVLETSTWRASPDWISALGYSSSAFTEINRNAIDFAKNLKTKFDSQLDGPIVLSAAVGPRGDGYHSSNKMDTNTAEQYHSSQISLFKEVGGIDVVTAITMNYVEEAIGIVKACNKVQLPCVVSFTLETDGKLPSGMSLKNAIETVDASVNTPPIYYMINCTHPKHFINELQRDGSWVRRIRAIRANASCKSHAELDGSTELDRGNIKEFAMLHKELKQMFPHINVFGGCCGTDQEHVEAIFNQLSSQ